MKNYRMNPDKEYVSKIIDGILRKDGHCPCRVIVSDETLCPCDEFLTKGECKCHLFIKRDQTEKENNNGTNKDSL